MFTNGLQGPSEWDSLARGALEAAGLHAGDAALHVGRYFSMRDLLKWCRRMQVSILFCIYRTQRMTRAVLCVLCYCVLCSVFATQRSTVLLELGLNCCVVQSVHAPLLQRSVRRHDRPEIHPDVSLLPVAMREAAFLESADCYTAMIAKPEVRSFSMNFHSMTSLIPVMLH